MAEVRSCATPRGTNGGTGSTPRISRAPESGPHAGSHQKLGLPLDPFPSKSDIHDGDKKPDADACIQILRDLLPLHEDPTGLRVSGGGLACSRRHRRRFESTEDFDLLNRRQRHTSGIRLDVSLDDDGGNRDLIEIIGLEGLEIAERNPSLSGHDFERPTPVLPACPQVFSERPFCRPFHVPSLQPTEDIDGHARLLRKIFQRESLSSSPFLEVLTQRPDHVVPRHRRQSDTHCAELYDRTNRKVKRGIDPMTGRPQAGGLAG